MKIAGFLMLIAGWAIVLASILLLASMKSRTLFTLAGIGVEAIGLALIARTHLDLEDDSV